MALYPKIKHIRAAFRDASAEMLAYKGRTFLGIIGVSIGIATLIVTVGAVRGAFKAWEDYIEENGGLQRLTLIFRYDQNRPSITPGLTSRTQAVIQRAFPRAVITTGSLNTQVQVRNIVTGKQADFALVGTSENGAAIDHVTLKAGRFICQADLARQLPVAVISEDIATRLGYSGDSIGSTILIDDRPFRVVGLYGRKDVNKRLPFNPRYLMIYVSATVVSAKLRYGDYINAVDISLLQKHELGTMVTAIRDAAQFSRHAGHDFNLITREDEYNAFRKTEITMCYASWTISIAILVIGGIGITNVMLASINERMREIGVRYALGATSIHIRHQFLLEAVAVCFTGGLIGIATGIVALPIAGSFIPLDIPGRPIFVPSALATAVCASVGVGILAGIYPAVRASKFNPMDALRNE